MSYGLVLNFGFSIFPYSLSKVRISLIKINSTVTCRISMDFKKGKFKRNTNSDSLLEQSQEPCEYGRPSEHCGHFE